MTRTQQHPEAASLTGAAHAARLAAHEQAAQVLRRRDPAAARRQQQAALAARARLLRGQAPSQRVPAGA